MPDRIDPADFIVKSKIRTLYQEADMRVSEEVWNELGHRVTRAVKESIRRAQANGRKTVKGCDF
ncbi:MAG: hypothetical protein D6798_14745 [Deltaproteobacteria bacterium]|nr:MAG: hypothetical protein D6798_14745 [Deltaproteobacteria bacterium]